MQVTLENASTEVSIAESSAPEKEAFHLVIAYEDSICRKSAQQASDFVASRFDEGVMVTTSQWKFDVLQSRSLRELAAEDAQSADMIIIAAHGGRDFSAELKTWVETWKRSDRHRALVAVLQRDPGEANDCEQNWLYLRNLALAIGMDFIASEHESQPWDID